MARRTSRRSPDKQAAFYVRKGLSIGKPRHQARDDGLIHSIGTARSYQQALKLFCQWIQSRRRGDLRSADVGLVQEYLNERRFQVGQKTLDRDRQATQFLLRQCGTDVKLQRLFSTFRGGRKLANQSRGYTPEQVEAIASSQSARTALATRIAYAAGLRAHELLTIRRKSEQPVSTHRKWSNKRFAGRNGEAYTVIGKGGLIREIRLPGHLAQALEDVRLAESKTVVDRKIKYRQHYNLTGGVYFSFIFGKTSKAVLGWSTGAHGLRHGYAHDRMSELLDLGFTRADRMGVISQELGHFRPDIVTEYLR